MKSKRPPASATTPFEYPRGAPSDSGLMKVTLILIFSAPIVLKTNLTTEATEEGKSDGRLHDFQLITAGIANIKPQRARRRPWITDYQLEIEIGRANV